MIQPMRLLSVGTSYRAADFDLVNALLFSDSGRDAP